MVGFWQLQRHWRLEGRQAPAVQSVSTFRVKYTQLVSCRQASCSIPLSAVLCTSIVKVKLIFTHLPISCLVRLKSQLLQYWFYKQIVLNQTIYLTECLYFVYLYNLIHFVLNYFVWNIAIREYELKYLPVQKNSIKSTNN